MLLVECEIEAKAKERFSMPDLKPYLMYDKEQYTRVDGTQSSGDAKVYARSLPHATL